MSAPELLSWTQDPKMRRALVEGIGVVRGWCDSYDPDALIGVLLKHGYCVIPAPEPLGPPRDPRHIADILPEAVADLVARQEAP